MLDTRDLIQKREDLKTEILNAFNEEFPQYACETFDEILLDEEEIQLWKDDWVDELEEIEEIDDIENEIGSEFDYGVTLVKEDDFEDYCEEFAKDCGYISDNFPSWIEVDWSRTADNLRQDYIEVEYQGDTYLARA